jgi:pimeloyl-ACP methyl ester carboxylesterase
MRFVTCTDGVQLAVYEAGPVTAPTVVMVHGYPDNHAVWDGLVAQLSDRYRVVTYDVRGCGASDKPTSVASYRLDQLRADLWAVLAQVSPFGPVHLVGHDWGSIQAWEAVTDPDRADRIASFVSISGPCLAQAGRWLSQLPKHPLEGLAQLKSSWYLFAFQVPLVPELLIRRGLFDLLLRDDIPRTEPDKINGLQLYRANLFRGSAVARPHSTDVPVLVVAPQQDAYVTVPLQTQAPVPFVPNLTVQTVAGGHWVASENPRSIAALVDEQIRYADR